MVVGEPSATQDMSSLNLILFCQASELKIVVILKNC